MDLPTPPLTIDEASDAVVHWLTQTAWEDVSVEAAADGLVEFGGQNLVARLRWDSAAVSQAAVLALLRAQEDDERLILFSVSGFTPGADALATAQGVALFDLGPDGSAKPIGTVAERLVPRIEPTPAFPHRVAEAPVPQAFGAAHEVLSAADREQTDWRDCPSCGATHHPKANFCAACGTDLTTETDTKPATPVAAAQTRPSLRCRTCGSHDIELIGQD